MTEEGINLIGIDWARSLYYTPFEYSPTQSSDSDTLARSGLGPQTSQAPCSSLAGEAG